MKTLIIEGRYDSLVTKLSNKLLSIVKDSYSSTQSEDGMFAGKKTYYAKGESVPHIENHPEIYFEEIEAKDIPLEAEFPFTVTNEVVAKLIKPIEDRLTVSAKMMYL